MERIIVFLSDLFQFESFKHVFKTHEKFIMTRGLRYAGFTCLAVAIIYGVLAYIEFQRL